MKQLRVTPLNIASAGLLTWMLWKILNDDYKWSVLIWMLLLLVFVIVGDQFFRVMLKSLKRIWIVEGIFVIFVVLTIWLLQVW